MRSTKINLMQSVWLLLVICCAFFGASTTLFSEGTVVGDATEKIAPSKIFYVTWRIDRNVGPFLRQVKARMQDVPAPHNDVALYEGHQWDELVDLFLTKKDSAAAQPFPVMIPLPAGCFDRQLSAARKSACLSNPAAFAQGVLEISLLEVNSSKPLLEILESKGVPASESSHPFYNQNRWVNVVKNLNPKLASSGVVQSGTALMMPTITDLSPAKTDDGLADQKAGSDSEAANVITMNPESAAALSQSGDKISTESSEQALAKLGSSVDNSAISGGTAAPNFVEVTPGAEKGPNNYYTAVEAAAAEKAAKVANIAGLARAQKDVAEADAQRAKYEAEYTEAIRRKNEAADKAGGSLKPVSEAISAAEALKDAKEDEAANAAEAAKAAELSAVARAAEAVAAAEAAKAAEVARQAEAAKAAEAERVSKAAAKAKAEEAERIAAAARAAELKKAEEAAKAAKAAEAARAAELAKAAKAKKAAEALEAAKAAEALARKVAMESERSSKAAEAAKSAEAAVAALAAEAAERAKRLADAKRSMSGNSGDWERVPGKGLSFSLARNVLSSARSPMLKKQSTAHLVYSQADDETMELYGSALHSSFVKAQSESELLTKTDDPLEYFRFSNIDFGAKFYFQGLASNMELYAGLYARLAIMDIRYYISNHSDGVAYLLEEHTDHNVGLGFTGGVTFTKKNMRYRISAVKDLYEFVDQALMIDRGNNRFTISYYTPRTDGRSQAQKNYDLFVESETIDVQLVEKEATLNAQMKRFSVGLGLGVAW